MAARQAAINPSVFLRSAAVLIGLLLLLAWCAISLHKFAYAKLQPVAVEFTVQTNVDQQLRLEYDYGYGFNAAHSQSQPVAASADPTLVKFTVSAWKMPQKLRLIAEMPNSFELASTTLQQGSNLIRLLNSQSKLDESGSIILTIDTLPALLADGS